MAEVSGTGSAESASSAGNSSGRGEDNNRDNSSSGAAASTDNSTGGKGAATVGDSEKSSDQSTGKPGNGADSATPTTADTIASTPTSADTLAAQPASKDTLTGPGIAAAAMGSESAVDRLADIADKAKDYLSEDHGAKGSLYANEDKSVTVGSGKIEYTAPHQDLNSEQSNYSAGAGFEFDVTVARAEGSTPVTPLADVDASLALGTVNANAVLSGNAQFKGVKSTISAKGAAGAEAMAIDGKIGGEISITPKTIGDTIGGAYNSVIDPVVDWVAGENVPGIPEVPDSWDHGITIGGHVEGGFGASAKGSAGLDIGNGKGAKISGSLKAGIGPVVGAGISFGVK